MDRLTDKETRQPILDYKGLLDEQFVRWSGAACKKLADYEDLGTPEQLAALKQENERYRQAEAEGRFAWIPETGIEDLSDGYHSFHELYNQRAILFAAICNQNKDKAWKSLKQHDGTMFDGGYFIVGVETPQGQYTYHYKLDRWDLYDVKELDFAPEWDGHTADDVSRLLLLSRADAEAALAAQKGG
jgi:hypothetical protein